MKEYWRISHGGNRASVDNQHLKTNKDIAETIGESEWNTRQIMKLNNLIPEIQQLISNKKIGTTAGEQLAYLTEDIKKLSNSNVTQSSLSNINKSSISISKALQTAAIDFL